jgi:potassium/hydrogen antiporter
MAYSILGVALLFYFGHALGWFFEKTKIPDLLIILIIGYILGPVLGYLTPEAFGQSGRLISTVALVVILYQGGLTLSASQLKECFGISALLSMLSFFSIAIITAVLCFIFGGFSFTNSILAGLGVGSTSSAIVIPMVKTLSIQDRSKTILSLESAFTDVLAIVFFLVIADGVEQNTFSPQALLIKIGPNTLWAMLLGVFAAILWGVLKKHYYNVFKMAFAGEFWALLVYSVIEILGFNGGIGVLALGFALANLDLFPKIVKARMSSVPVSYKELDLLNELIFMLRTFFFIYLGVLVTFSDWLIVSIALLVTASVFATRYIIAKLLFSKSESKLDPMIITAMGPRGLACAVVATIPVQRGFEDGIMVQNIVFAIIPLTILATAILVAVFENNYFRSKLQNLW